MSPAFKLTHLITNPKECYETTSTVTMSNDAITSSAAKLMKINDIRTFLFDNKTMTFGTVGKLNNRLNYLVFILLRSNI